MSDRAIQKIFQAQYHTLINSPQPIKNLKAIDGITHCRTASMGSSYYQCSHQHRPIEVHHSCRNRSCYLCAQKQRQEWIEKQKHRLFSCAHFHVVFTLPHEYLSLWRYNERFFAQLLFSASRDTLMLVEDQKYHGVTPGIMTALHTWGRQMTLHPHVHCLVSAGGLTNSDQWRSIDTYLLPIKVVKSRYRGLIQKAIEQALDEDRLTLPPDMSERSLRALWSQLWKKAWSVRIEQRYEHGKGVMLYLSRYLKGGPMSPSQILYRDKKEIRFRYFDHRSKRKKTLCLSLGEFTKRLLTHVPHVGLHTFRYYGLYAPAAKRRRLEAYRSIGDRSESLEHGAAGKDVVLFCLQCGSPARRTHSFWRSEATKAFSINKNRASGCVPGFIQQDDEPDTVGAGLADTS